MNIDVEKIKKSIDKAAVFTVKKTGEVISLGKLKVKKAEAKGRLSDFYKELGQLVYSNSKLNEDITERFNFLISKIDEIHDELDKYSSEENEIK